MKNILTLNAGSTSLKYALFSEKTFQLQSSGQIEGIGKLGVRDHAAAYKKILPNLKGKQVDVVVHRYVHGGEKFQEPTRVTARTLQKLVSLHHLAPLHNPVQYATLLSARKAYPGVPHILVFDTAFHSTIRPPHNAYALPRTLSKKYGLRVFGFHGLSHEHARNSAVQKLKKPLEKTNIISVHLGGGTSVCAIKNGKSFAISMGSTPLSGAMMMTRAGDIDPAIPLILMRDGRMSVGKIEHLLNSESGIFALTGTADFRKVVRAVERGSANATEAFEMYCVSIQKYLAYYLAILGTVDALVFTGAIGAKSIKVRKALTRPLLFRKIHHIVTDASEEFMLAQHARPFLRLS